MRKFLYVVRLQYCLYFCVFKYVQAIKEKGFLLSTWEACMLCMCETLKLHCVVGKCFYNHTMMVGY